MSHFLEVCTRFAVVFILIIGVSALGMAVWTMFQRLATCH
jgi:hypothetical protein